MTEFNRNIAKQVSVGTRVVVNQKTITAPSSNGVTLSSLCDGSIIPSGAEAVEIQAIGGAVRIGLVANNTVTPVTGMQINQSELRLIDISNLSNVTIVAESSAALCNVTFFDRV